MLTGIGTKRIPVTQDERDIVVLLLECHERIRGMTALALRIAEAKEPPAAEVADAAGRVRRYFGNALGLHARDEEESILPRLRGRDPAVDVELDEMHREHGEHEAPVARLVELAAALESVPARHAELAAEVGAVARELKAHFEAHLGREERVIFPAIGRLVGPQDRARMVEELRARRGS